MNNLSPFISILLPLIGAIFGYFVKYNIDRKREIASEVTKERREHYQLFVNLVIDIFRGTKAGKQQTDSQQLLKLFDFYKKYILYASPEVINNFSDYFQFLYAVNRDEISSTHSEHFKKLSKIMQAMRADLGLSNRKLGNDGQNIFRALLTDFDKIFK